jgi:DNA-directed RNA polymerase specialized sigma24 family protein
VLQNFPADTQRAVKLCYEQELTYREIAEVIGSNPTSVFRQIAAVRERLARLLEADQLAA